MTFKCELCPVTGTVDEVVQHLRDDHKYNEEDAELCAIPLEENPPDKK